MKLLKLTLLAIFALANSTAIWAGAEGTYRLDTESLLEEITKLPEFAEAPEMQQTMMKNAFAGMEISLTLSKDGSFDASTTIMGQQRTASGTWKLEDDELVVKTLVEDGVEQTEPEVGRFPFDGNGFVMSDEGMPFGIPIVKVD